MKADVVADDLSRILSSHSNANTIQGCEVQGCSNSQRENEDRMGRNVKDGQDNCSYHFRSLLLLTNC